jgi:hypothetical protein
MSRGCDFGRSGCRFEHLDGITVPAPAAGDLDDVLGDHLFVLDTELSPDGEMMEGPGSAVRQDVEPRQIATRGASVSGRRHALKLMPILSTRCGEPPHIDPSA